MDHQARSVPKVAAMQATPLKSAMIGLALSFMLGLAAMLALSQAVYAQAGAVPAPIGVIKHVSAETATIGDSVRYTITVRNDYTESLPIAVTDVLPQDVQFSGNLEASSGGAQFNDANHGVKWDLTLRAAVLHRGFL